MIELVDICKSFGSRTVLNCINLTINTSEVTFIVGASGAGKTTLLNIIGGLSKADSGKILLNGEEVTDKIDKYRSEQVGFIFQDFNLINGLSVYNNVLIGNCYSGRIETSKKEISGILSELGMKKTDQKSETLSGGEKQRTAIARTLSKKKYGNNRR